MAGLQQPSHTAAAAAGPEGGRGAPWRAPHTLAATEPGVPRQPAADGGDAHRSRLEGAFAADEAQRWVALDGSASLLLVCALCRTLGSFAVLRAPGGWQHTAAAGAALVALAAPGLASRLLPPERYLACRTALVASCRVSSALLLGQVVPAAWALPAGARWAGWLHFLQVTRVAALAVCAACAPLPLKWLALVQLACTAEAARLLPAACSTPPLCSAEAQRHLRHVADAAASLRWCAPLPFLAPAPAPGVPQPDAARCSPDQQRLCQQVALWLLACVGCALPLLCAYLARVAALRAFVRARCERWPRCASCGSLFTPDLPTLLGTAALLYAALCAAAWQALAAAHAALDGAARLPA